MNDQLWYGQDEIWTGCPSRSEYPYGSKSSFFTELAWRSKAEIKFTIEIKDQPKKALEGIAIFLYYFN